MLKILAPMTACATALAAGYSPKLNLNLAPAHGDTKEILKTTSHARPPLPPFLVGSATHAGTHTPDIPSMSEDRV